MLNCWGIHSISCQYGLPYIGQTKLRLYFRLNEHKLNIRNQETNKSAIAKHYWENDHAFKFHSAKGPFSRYARDNCTPYPKMMVVIA